MLSLRHLTISENKTIDVSEIDEKMTELADKTNELETELAKLKGDE